MLPSLVKTLHIALLLYEIPNLYNWVQADVEKSLTPDWQLESDCLETQFFPEDRLAHNIRKFFKNMLEE